MQKREDRIRGVAKEWWLRGVSCSEASTTTHNRCAGIATPLEEQASHLLSGGMMHQGNACGLLSGAVLSAGLQAARRFDDDAMRSAATLCASVRLAEAFRESSGAVDCREITGQSLATLREKAQYMREGKARQCGQMLMKWANRTDTLVDDVLTEFESGEPSPSCANCAVETFEKIASEEEFAQSGPTYVAGLAGGVGLLGRSCAALTVGILILTLRHYASRRSQRRDSRFLGSLHELGFARFRKRPARLLQEFKLRFGSDLCSEIIGRLFTSPDDHASFIAEGGCREVITFVEGRVSEAH
ncbi:MAG: C_GCAxxG_C_C family protein [bacterium]|nr:C_GCAxxG_C_C family protein [bacterium]